MCESLVVGLTRTNLETLMSYNLQILSSIFGVFLSITFDSAANAFVTCRQQARNAPENSQCLTYRGFVFTRVKQTETGLMGWRDGGPGGKTWYDGVGTGNQINAANTCDTIVDQTLASRDHILVGLSHGFDEIVRDIEGLNFWTSNYDYPKGGLYFWNAGRSFSYVGRDVEMHFKCTSNNDATPAISACVVVKDDAPDGTECLTSRGARFRKVKIAGAKPTRGWQDLGLNGKLWYLNSRGGKYDAEDAFAFCQAEFSSSTVPQKVDFELAASRGIKEVHPALSTIGPGFWTRTQSADGKYFYYDSSADFFRTNRYAVGGFVSAICVNP